MASLGFCAYIGMHMLSVQNMPPSSGISSARSRYLLFRSAWKMSPDQACVTTVSPFFRWSM